MASSRSAVLVFGSAIRWQSRRPVWTTRSSAPSPTYSAIHACSSTLAAHEVAPNKPEMTIKSETCLQLPKMPPLARHHSHAILARAQPCRMDGQATGTGYPTKRTPIPRKSRRQTVEKISMPLDSRDESLSPPGKVLVAIANKHARQLWAMLRRGEDYDSEAWLQHPMVQRSRKKTIAA